MGPTYWAHSARTPGQDQGCRQGWQTLPAHLEAVARIAGELAGSARPGDDWFRTLTGVAGWLHDYGKYSDAFQRMLARGNGRCQHAIHGAALLCLGAGTSGAIPWVAAAIAGHHAGIPDFTGDGRSLRARLSDRRYREEAAALKERACNDCGSLGAALETPLPPANTVAEMDLYTRMLFSCLVDADRLDAAGRKPLRQPLSAQLRLDQLTEYVRDLARKASDRLVKQMRAQVLEDCIRAAGSESRLFSLSVPTGGGKTLAAMAFALRRAALYPERFRRVIVVIPYLSIIEQNAEVYAAVFGRDAVLEHHSGSLANLQPANERFVPAEEDNDEEDYQRSGVRTETENWDAPVIVTTSVRFFETLFSNHPRDLRRVHNIARSIVILDEVQTLPQKLLAPLLDMMRDLALNWDVNFVFSTATQPAFERPAHKHDLRWEPGTVSEIVRDPGPLRAALKRVEIRWEISRPVGWPELAQRMLEGPQCLAVVNVRDHARDLYLEVKNRAGADSVFHLSTRMSAAHRLRKLAEIRGRLKAGEPCYVVSTQLVEAGVDLDFPVVLRALAPLDSVIQAAGRADREGRLTAECGRPGGLVVVFLPEDHRTPPNEYARAAGITEGLAKAAIETGTSIQVDSARAMAQYFEQLYGESGVDLGAALVGYRETQCFATLSREFEMISSRTRDVFVPDDEEARKAIQQLSAIGRLTAELRRRLQRHVIGLSPGEFEKARGVLYQQLPEVWIAVEQGYNEQLGLIFDGDPAALILCEEGAEGPHPNPPN